MSSRHHLPPTAPDPGRVAELVAALAPADPVRAVAHLSSPALSVLGRQVRVTGDVVTFRDRRLCVSRESLPVLTREVARLVGAATATTDSFLEVTLGPVGWVKPVRTGAHVVLFGSRELFGGPLVRVAAPVWTTHVAAQVLDLAAGRHLRDGADVPLGGVHLRVRGDTDVVTVGVNADLSDAGSLGGLPGLRPTECDRC